MTHAAPGPPTLPSKAGPGSLARRICPHNPISTLDIETCEERKLLELDRAFNKQAAVLWSVLDTLGRRAF